MIQDAQVKRLRKYLNGGMTLVQAALRTGMTEKTARKYRTMNRLPSESKKPHDWRTRTDPFESVWPEIQEQLETALGLQAKTIFQSLQRQQPGKFQDGQLRTLQRKIKQWRATGGPAKEVFFDQIHHPGDLCASDFTRMGSLGITINFKRALKKRSKLRMFRWLREPQTLIRWRSWRTTTLAMRNGARNAVVH